MEVLFSGVDLGGGLKGGEAGGPECEVCLIGRRVIHTGFWSEEC